LEVITNLKTTIKMNEKNKIILFHLEERLEWYIEEIDWFESEEDQEGLQNCRDNYIELEGIIKFLKEKL